MLAVIWCWRKKVNILRIGCSDWFKFPQNMRLKGLLFLWRDTTQGSCFNIYKGCQSSVKYSIHSEHIYSCVYMDLQWTYKNDYMPHLFWKMWQNNYEDKIQFIAMKTYFVTLDWEIVCGPLLGWCTWRIRV